MDQHWNLYYKDDFDREDDDDDDDAMVDPEDPYEQPPEPRRLLPGVLITYHYPSLSLAPLEGGHVWAVVRESGRPLSVSLTQVGDTGALAFVDDHHALRVRWRPGASSWSVTSLRVGTDYSVPDPVLIGFRDGEYRLFDRQPAGR
ncbi:hypothetical protein DL766_004103 [Monosporascus sp. MC13-8B]|uniref:Anaphase-promoting complex subunit 4 WD40 domain-containing protein n=1 Tax=Monosporascus cannonballus TaxID=155416 RepID=A0ABY0HMG4_9PEZI|nr:hypothetical protein DL762_000796 [Monosporascus cannonballus]RYO96385.1 hypothetical protein DL763_003241 [Monosporascus cannonballus]RYP32096.1 hypothetical protein DL766_004103 [Monosporascus sp. MC13-8B]